MFSFSEEGVSPVVGVLLLVCLTVVMVGICGVMFAGLMPSETDTRYVEEMERKFFWGSGNSYSLIEGPNLFPIEKITIQYDKKYPLLISVKGIILVTHAGRAGDAVGHGSFRYTAFGTNTASDAVFFHELNELCRSCA